MRPARRLPWSWLRARPHVARGLWAPKVGREVAGRSAGPADADGRVRALVGCGRRRSPPESIPVAVTCGAPAAICGKLLVPGATAETVLRRVQPARSG